MALEADLSLTSHLGCSLDDVRTMEELGMIELMDTLVGKRWVFIDEVPDWRTAIDVYRSLRARFG